MSSNMSQKDIEAFLTGEEKSPQKPKVQRIKFPQLQDFQKTQPLREVAELSDIRITVSIELGRTKLKIRDVLSLQVGSIIELNKVAGEPVDVLLNEHPFGTGEIVVINEILGVRISRSFEETE